jgi:hypothetical protein
VEEKRERVNGGEDYVEKKKKCTKEGEEDRKNEVKEEKNREK